MSEFLKFLIGWLVLCACIALVCEAWRPSEPAAIVFGFASGLAYTLSVMRWTKWLG